jgi:hypothetical protein
MKGAARCRKQNPWARTEIGFDLTKKRTWFLQLNRPSCVLGQES